MPAADAGYGDAPPPAPLEVDVPRRNRPASARRVPRPTVVALPEPSCEDMAADLVHRGLASPAILARSVLEDGPTSPPRRGYCPDRNTPTTGTPPANERNTP